jgi:hypothetical protein
MKPLQGQLSLLAGTDDHDERLNVSAGRYQAHSGIVADDAGACWRGYSPDTSEATARLLFRVRFGHDPATIRRGVGGILLAGPVTNEVRR